MNREREKVGFDRQIRMAWLDATADWVDQGLSAQEIRGKLDQFLDGKVGGTGSNSAKGKTKTVLLHIWALVPEHIKPLRDEGLELLRQQPESNRITVHWGLCIATYPFFRVVAETVGRLLKLQGEFACSQVQRRIEEVFGSRETVVRAVSRVLQSLVEWGILQETEERGTYRIAVGRRIEDPNLAAWLVESALISGDSSATVFTALTQTPALFPFSLDSLSVRQLERRTRLELLRQGLDQDMVRLRGI